MLDRLPPEVLLLIGEWLDLVQPCSVLDLAYTSKRCYSIVVAISYQTLAFSTNIGKLQQDIQEYSKLLKRVNGRGRVSRLIITDEIRTKTPQQEEWCRPKMSRSQYNGSDIDVFKEKQMSYEKRPVRDVEGLDILYKEDYLWKPLATFIEQLPALKSIFYNNFNQFPPILLDSIHCYQPHCSLYLTDFFLWSLDAHGTDDYEFRLATSPCLRGIISQHEDIDGYQAFGNVTYQYEALQSLIGGLTPNLKALYVFQDHPLLDDDELLPHRDEWAHFKRNSHISSTQSHSGGSLENFGFSSYRVDLEEFRGYIESIDLSKLKVLRLSGLPLEVDMVEYLSSCRFPALQKLEINLLRSRYEPLDDIKSAANRFLLNLPPLTRLELFGWHPEI